MLAEPADHGEDAAAKKAKTAARRWNEYCQLVCLYPESCWRCEIHKHEVACAAAGPDWHGEHGEEAVARYVK